jgi:hypothetical protein
MANSARYFLLLGVQTIGATMLFSFAVPLYRQVMADPGGHEPRPETLGWAFSAIALMQTGYWIRHRLGLPIPRLRNVFAGHIILFAARMSFVLATSSFTFVVIAQNAELQIPTFRYFVFAAGLFALFCYVRELERLGKNFFGPNERLEEIDLADGA